ncbi:MAG: helix-turn-helix domain-containing protein [Sphingomonas sp.]
MKDRIRSAIGEEPVAAFARRCGFGESLLRKYLAGAEPSAKNLARIADAAGVSLEWLATGRGPMRREAAKHSPDQAESGPVAGPRGRRWRHLIELVETSDDPDRTLADLFARAEDEAKRRALERTLAELRAEIERLKKTA